jgi:O-antigen/teichoic acid export membrane protein
MITSLFYQFKNNKLLSTASYAFMLNLGYAGISFLLGLILAKVLGSDGLGVFDYTESWIEILAILAIFGFDRLLIRNLPAYGDKANWDLMKGILWFSSLITLFLALFLALVFAIVFIVSLNAPANTALVSLADFKASQDTFLISCLLAMLLLPLRVALRLLQAIMQGFQKIVKSLLPEYILRPFILVFGLCYFLLFSSDKIPPYFAILLHLLATIIALAYGIYALIPYIPKEIWQAKPRYESSKWLIANSAFVLALVAIIINARLGVLFLGSLSSLDQLSYFSLAVRLSAVITLAQTAMNITIQPQIVRLFEKQNFASLQTLIFVAVRSVTLVSLPPALILIFFGQYILTFIGGSFTGAYAILVVICVGQLLSVASGPVGNLLTMTGYEKDVAIVNIAIVFLSAILLYMLIPVHQALGAAYATSISLILRNILLMVLSYWRLGIVTIPLHWTKKE